MTDNSSIKDLLPSEEGQNYEDLKKKHPHNILQQYAQVITEKYKNKLFGIVTVSTDISEQKVVYAFHIGANIGNGYSYRLFEVVPVSNIMYPLEITIFEEFTRKFADVSTSEEFEIALQNIFKEKYTHNLILYLLAQIN